MSFFESRTKMDNQKLSPNAPVSVPLKGGFSVSGSNHSSGLQLLADKSPRVMQLKAFASMANASDRVIQLASRVDWTSQQFQYTDAEGNLQTEEVGSTMTAHLDPDHPIKGADADSTSSADLYNALKRHWEPGSKHWVRGHVLNHDLGGPNTTPNLFPITGHANGDHSNYVEEHVKSALHRGKTVKYTVTATQQAGNTNHAGTGRDIRNAGGTFVCVASWNESADDRKTISRTINSTPSLKAAFGNGAGARAGRSFSDIVYADADTIAVRNGDNEVTGGGEVDDYNIPDGWAHGEMDADARAQWMTDHRTAVGGNTYRQDSVAPAVVAAVGAADEAADVVMGGGT